MQSRGPSKFRRDAHVHSERSPDYRSSFPSMISVSHVFAFLALNSLVFKMGRVISPWVAAGGSGAVGDPSCPERPGHPAAEGAGAKAARGPWRRQVGQKEGPGARPSFPFTEGSGRGRLLLQRRAEPHQPCDFLEYVMRPQPFGCRSLNHQDAKNNDRSALPQKEMAPLETGDGPSSTLLTARALHGFLWAAEGVCGGAPAACERRVHS